MNETNTTPERAMKPGWPDFLEATENLYRLIGLAPRAAQAAAFADAELFLPTELCEADRVS